MDPNSVLSLLEGVGDKENSHIFFSRENNYFNEFTKLLRSIAYDPSLFERASHLLCLFAFAESPDENNNSIRRLLKSLFYISLSGTHATPEQRLSVISALLESDSESRVDLGLSLLSASLEAWHFNSSYSFEFGAHSRDYGWSPRSNKDINQWYKTFLDYLLPLASLENALAYKLRSLLSVKFRGLWTKAAMYDELEAAIKYISAKHTWNEGWTAVKSTLRFDGKEMAPNVVTKLNNLAEILAPTTLLDKARLYALSNHKNGFELIDTIEEESDLMEGITNLQKITCTLGQKVGTNMELVNELLPELLSHDGTRIFEFGQGLSESIDNKGIIWASMLQQLYSIPESKRNYQLFRGFLYGLSNTNNELCEQLLNEAITDRFLSSIFPIIQTSVRINKKGIIRLKQALELERTPIWMYRYLSYGRALDDISDNDFGELVEIIASKSEGSNVAIEIFHMRIHGKDKGTISDEILALGQKLLIQYSFTRNNATQKDYELGKLVEYCFSNAEAQENMRVVANKIATELEDHYFFPTDFDDILKAIALTHPFVFLDVFLIDKEVIYGLARLISDDLHSFFNPISVIEDDVILTWCDVNPEVRYQLIASVILPFKNNEHRIEWTPIAITLIKNSSDPVLVLKQFKRSFRPTSWSGSRADIMERFVPLISQLKEHDDAIVSQWAIQEERTFFEEILSEREWELAQDREQDERFE